MSSRDHGPMVWPLGLYRPSTCSNKADPIPAPYPSDTARPAGATLLTPDREIRPGRIETDASGRISAIVPHASSPVADNVLVPGSIDLQCNGAAGADLADATAEAFDAVGRALLSSGTTSWCPTLPSAPADRYAPFLDAAVDARTRPGPRLLGVHLEGPFLNPLRAGAHAPEALRAPDPDWLATLLDRHPDLVRIVTLAPELPGALEVVQLCTERGVTVAIGHTEATRDETLAAVDAGAALVTHLFNAMRPLHHREPGVVGTALIEPRLRVSMIADGAHVDGDLLGAVARMVGPHRGILVSDAVAQPTRPLRGGFELLDGCVRNLTRWGVPFGDAIRMATATPADLLGVPEIGRLEPGSFADAVLWRDGSVAEVWLGGEPVRREPV